MAALSVLSPPLSDYDSEFSSRQAEEQPDPTLEQSKKPHIKGTVSHGMQLKMEKVVKKLQ